MRNMKYTEIAEKILSNMNIDDKNFVAIFKPVFSSILSLTHRL